jgi:uncharacterized protein (DUF1499 family)
MQTSRALMEFFRSSVIVGAMVMLPPCPSTPNCVSTQATAPTHAIAPISYRGSAAAALARLTSIVDSMPRATITERKPASLRVEFRTRIFRFVDDVLFELDDAKKTVEFRSAARLGRRDFGVNRNRMEEIRRRFNDAAQP